MPEPRREVRFEQFRDDCEKAGCVRRAVAVAVCRLFFSNGSFDETARMRVCARHRLDMENAHA